MWDFLSLLLDPIASAFWSLFEFLCEDNRPEARTITVGCALTGAVLTLASVITVYLATMR